MRIEEGKYYRTRDGRKVGPMTYIGHYDEYGWCVLDLNNAWWNLEGKAQKGRACVDIISEWDEGPIRTEKVRRIKPGVYGLLGVDGENEKSVRIGFAGVMGDGQYFWATPTELRELARVALEIAEYLDAQ